MSRLMLAVILISLHSVSVAQFGIYQDADGNLKARMETLKPVKAKLEVHTGKVVRTFGSDLKYEMKDKSTRTTETDEKTVILDANKKKVGISSIKVGDQVKVTVRVNEMRQSDGSRAYMFDTTRIELLASATAKQP